MLHRVAVVAALALLLAACGSSPTAPAPVVPPPPTHFVEGYVRAFGSQAPVANATIEVTSGASQGARATSNDSGYYALGRIVEGAVTVRVTAPGYETVSAPASVTVDATWVFQLHATTPAR